MIVRPARHEHSPIERVLSRLRGVTRSGKGYRAHCPAHDDQHPSLSIAQGEDGRVLIMCHAGCPPEDIVRAIGLEMRDLFPHDDLPEARQSPKQMRHLEEERRREEILWETARYYHERLLHTEEALRYLTTERGLPADILERFLIGWADGTLRAHLLQRGYDEKHGLQAGVLKEENGTVRDFFYKRIVFPNICRGRVVHLTGRTLTDAEPKYLHVRGEISHLYNEDALRHDEVYVVEGVLDVLSLEAWGLPAVAPLGAGGLKETFLERLRRVKTVYLCLDGDRAGEDGARRAGQALGPHARIVSLPEGKDPNDLFREGKREEFLARVRAAQDPFQWSIQRIPPDTPKRELVDVLKPILEGIAELDPPYQEAYLEEIRAWFRHLTDADIRAYRRMIRTMIRKKRGKKEEVSRGVRPRRQEATVASVNAVPGRPERPCTDLGNAERFVRLYGDRIRYVDEWGWLVWDGKRWVRDPNAQQVARLAQDAVRHIYREAAEAQDADERSRLAKWAIASESQQRISALIKLAAPWCSASPRDFDTDEWLFNCENGVLNLKTRELAPHDNALQHRLTTLAPVAYSPNVDCPLWKTFLDRIFNGNESVIRFVQRAVGYSMTGSTREQCFFFLYGTGANGKSTFLEVIRALLGDYAATAEFSTFTADRKGTVRNDIARLRQARLVTAIEVGEGKRFAEELVKTLTGGDTVVARYLYREFFEFRPRFKVWLAANHKPEIRGTDWAIWRRIRLIPFTVTIPTEEQIPDLADRLKEELSGILNWALDGVTDWLENGLQPPPEVVEATEAYRAEMDIVGLFLKDACVLDPKAVTPSKQLYDAFQEWCAENGYEPFGQTTFGRRLAAKGFAQTREYSAGRRCRCWRGIGLLHGEAPQADVVLEAF